MLTLLDLPDLLQPGAWQEGAYSGKAARSEKNSERQKALERLQNLPPAKPIRNAKQLCGDFPRIISNDQQDHMTFCLSLPMSDDDTKRLLDAHDLIQHSAEGSDQETSCKM